MVTFNQSLGNDALHRESEGAWGEEMSSENKIYRMICHDGLPLPPTDKVEGFVRNQKPHQ